MTPPECNDPQSAKMQSRPSALQICEGFPLQGIVLRNLPEQLELPVGGVNPLTPLPPCKLRVQRCWEP